MEPRLSGRAIQTHDLSIGESDAAEVETDRGRFLGVTDAIAVLDLGAHRNDLADGRDCSRFAGAHRAGEDDLEFRVACVAHATNLRCRRRSPTNRDQPLATGAGFRRRLG